MVDMSVDAERVPRKIRSNLARCTLLDYVVYLVRFCSFTFPLLPPHCNWKCLCTVLYKSNPLFAQYLWTTVITAGDWMVYPKTVLCLPWSTGYIFLVNKIWLLGRAHSMVYSKFVLCLPWYIVPVNKGCTPTFFATYLIVCRTFRAVQLLNRIEWCTWHLYSVYHGRRGLFCR